MADQFLAAKIPRQQEGMIGEVIYRSRWYAAAITKVAPKSKTCDIRYIGRKTEYGEDVHEAEFRCLDCGGSPRVYVGMLSKCRDTEMEIESEETLFGYSPGQVSAYDGKDAIEFEFFSPSGRTASARVADLLYVGVPEGGMLGDDAEVAEKGEEGPEERIVSASSDSSDNEELPPRKRKPPAKFDPTTYKKIPRIEDSDSDGDSSYKKLSLAYKELFSGDEDEESQPATSRLGTASGAWGSNACNSSSAAGRWPSQSSNPNAAKWGSAVNIVTPTKLPEGGNSIWASASAFASVWGNSTSSASGHSAAGWFTPVGASSAISEPSFPGPAPKMKRTAPPKAVKSEGILEVYRRSNDDFFLRWKFGERIKIDEVGISEVESLEGRRRIGNLHCSLIARKMPDNRYKSTRSDRYDPQYVKACYLVESGPGFAPIDAKKELDKIADFSSLAANPAKLASRLELLVSKASRDSYTKNPHMFVLPSSCFEVIPERHNVGCGFIPEKMLEELLGCPDAKAKFAVQVRLVGPSKGIFKGMLVKRPRISKIMLPGSMLKVEKSKEKKKSFKGVWMEFINVFPSEPNKDLGRIFNPNLPNPGESVMEKKPKAPGESIRPLLRSHGVPDNVLDSYYKESKEWERHNHTFVVGVCDWTGCLPEGSVFLTGFGVGGQAREVFITRIPCVEKSDGLVAPLVNQKPDPMSEDDWEHLCSLQFGAVMFASPKDAEAASMPESMDGDLDGDLYFTCWDNEVLSNISHETQDADDSNSEDVQPEEDELVGAEYQTVRNKKSISAVVVEKKKDGKYLVEYSDGTEEVVSYDEVMDGRDFIDEIVGHRGRGSRMEVEYQYTSGKRCWHKLSTARKEVQDKLVKYAIQNNLRKADGWSWTKHYINDSPAIEIKQHRVKGGTLEVEVLFQDGTTDWDQANSFHAEEPLIVEKYVTDKGLLNGKEWSWLTAEMESSEKLWFERVQSHMANLHEAARQRRFLERMCRLHKKHVKEHGDLTHREAVAYARCCKQAIDMQKHGGRASLPEDLLGEALPKTSRHMDKFVKVEEGMAV